MRVQTEEDAVEEVKTTEAGALGDGQKVKPDLGITWREAIKRRANSGKGPGTSGKTKSEK